MWPGSVRLSGRYEVPVQLIRLTPFAGLRTRSTEHWMFLFLLHCQPAGLGGMWSSPLYPFISTPLLRRFVTALDFAFVVLMQTHQIRGVNYYLFWDASPGSPTGWFQLWQQEEHIFGGKKGTVLPVVMSICVGRVPHGVIPTHFNCSLERWGSPKTVTEKSSKFISKNGCVVMGQRERMERPQVAPAKVQVGYYENFLHWKID